MRMGIYTRFLLTTISSSTQVWGCHITQGIGSHRPHPISKASIWRVLLCESSSLRLLQVVRDEVCQIAFNLANHDLILHK